MSRSRPKLPALGAACALIAFPLSAVVAAADAGAVSQPCAIEVAERGTGWPVPLVELRTTHNARFVSDNAGRIAIDLPELMGQPTWFNVVGHGYEAAKDGFGFRGVRLTPQPATTLRVELRRTTIARRIGRITGGGIFGESQRLGLERQWRESGVWGCDSVQNAVHCGRLFWAWGDTTLPHYPLGVFHMTAATSDLRPLASTEPPLRLRLDYVTDEKGRPRAVCEMPGRGPTWASGFVSLKDKSGQPRLVASYAKIKPPLAAYQVGLAVWNDGSRRFEPLRIVWTKSDDAPKPPPYPVGHPLVWNDGGRVWLLFGDPLPTLRCPATFEAWQDPATWEELRPQATVPAADGGAPVVPHSGSIAWHPWRKRWVTVFMQKLGTPTPFGELWYAEAAAPPGPWGPAVKVLTHENYTFYNPRLHPEFAAGDSPLLFFEGTYTATFSSNKEPTPRWDYNQVLYRLDLDDPALAPARGR